MSGHCGPENPRFIVPKPLIYTGFLKQPGKISFQWPLCTNQHTQEHSKCNKWRDGSFPVQVSTVVSKCRHNCFASIPQQKWVHLLGKNHLWGDRKRQQHLQQWLQSLTPSWSATAQVTHCGCPYNCHGLVTVCQDWQIYLYMCVYIYDIYIHVYM